MKILRKQIRNIILEAMHPPSSTTEKFAILTDWFEEIDPAPGQELHFILYNWETYQNKLSSIGENMSIIDTDEIEAALWEENENGYSNIVAVLQVEVPNSGEGDCNLAWQVTRAAADGGYGPTLYDLVMSISPNGLTSDRNSVSKSARKIWKYYANKRPKIEKKFLDPIGFTETETDDCTTWSKRTSLHDVSRIMAIEFVKESYPLAYEMWEKQIPMESLISVGKSNGNEWIRSFAGFIIDELSEEDEQILYSKGGEVTGHIFEEWSDYKKENEHRAYDYSDGYFEDPEYLDLSYNTDYATSDFYKLQENHDNCMHFIATELEWDEDPWEPIHLLKDSFTLQVLVRDFFNKRYQQ